MCACCLGLRPCDPAPMLPCVPACRCVPTQAPWTSQPRTRSVLGSPHECRGRSHEVNACLVSLTWGGVRLESPLCMITQGRGSAVPQWPTTEVCGCVLQITFKDVAGCDEAKARAFLSQKQGEPTANHHHQLPVLENAYLAICAYLSLLEKHPRDQLS